MNTNPLQIIFRAVKSFYFIAGVTFVVWMLFFDSTNIINQVRLNRKLSDLKSQEGFYKHEIDRLEKDMQELSSDPDELEKFVREKYFFKKRSEEVYILEGLDEE